VAVIPTASRKLSRKFPHSLRYTETMSEEQPKNPLHGLTLNTIITELVETYGFDDLSQRIAIRCFTQDPSIQSSLKFLRRTPWAREKVEGLYLWHLREQKRRANRPQ
jgi:uncharacterized protein (DUF2132 family)